MYITYFKPRVTIKTPKTQLSVKKIDKMKKQIQTKFSFFLNSVLIKCLHNNYLCYNVNGTNMFFFMYRHKKNAF